ncbi:Er-based factor for assembly of v-atpase [Thalictrum thalictroides]|uniref:Er-based factor for assembly of v-atpase n=1 Tax=Thalictrum thalictroides TaxID=46969 RepID=A0A7J6XA36_THATH|nr:Er-based factor for assembly of v-atpase [Thalictrum thalictroides]
MIETISNSSKGLIISNNETIRLFLRNSIKDPNLNEEFHQLASNLSSQNCIPYKLLKTLWSESSPSIRPKLLHLFSGSDFVFSTPKPREKSEELKARLKKLEDLAERKAYNELVKDITPRKNTEEPFSSYKDQLGFGLHVVLTMFTGYLVGYAAFRALFNRSAVMNAAGGILGLILAMLLETFLFIIKTSNQDLASQSASSVLKKQQ